MGESTELCGTVEKVIFKSAENGYAVFSLKVSGSETVTAHGYLTEVFQGERVSLKGQWSFHKKFGRQFEVKEYTTQAPTSVDGIQKYLASGLIKGIGPKFAERLVKKFGAQTLQVIDKTPNLLQEVSGVGPKRIMAIMKAWEDQKEIANVMVFLRGKDVSTAFAVKIYKTYGNESIKKMQENPYRLVDDIWGVGFKTADQIALKLGLEPHSLERIKAAITHTLSQATSQGHLYLEVEQVKKEVAQLIQLDAKDTEHKTRLKAALHEQYEEEKIKLITNNDQHYLALPQFYFSEMGIAKKVRKLLTAKRTKKLDMDAIYNHVRQPDGNGFALNDDQQEGILSCMQHSVSIITGGPGTGKTTLVKKMLEVLEQQHCKFRLAAPTGRAAKRMFEGTGRSTETLHRLLEFTPGSMGFARNEQNALELDFLIVDEASMIDVFLMHAILKALPQNAHLVLIGDIDQLPSVGAGNILNDLIASKEIAVVKLTQIFRQAQDSMIIVNAHRVNRGEFPSGPVPGSKRDFIYIKEEIPENIFPLLQNIYKKKLPQLGIDPKNTVTLVPMNRGTVGTQRINQELQKILNPHALENKIITRFSQEYKINDRVMQVRNNYDKFVFNGDMGTIKDINIQDQQLMIAFGERVLEYDFAELNEIALAYATSIHKSQGSEFDAVIIPIFMQHFMLLQRNLIYTGITRAKKLCILIGQPKAISMGIKNNKGTVRNTFLKEFLTSDLEAR